MKTKHLDILILEERFSQSRLWTCLRERRRNRSFPRSCNRIPTNFWRSIYFFRRNEDNWRLSRRQCTKRFEWCNESRENLKKGKKKKFEINGCGGRKIFSLRKVNSDWINFERKMEKPGKLMKEKCRILKKWFGAVDTMNANPYPSLGPLL